MRYALGTAVVVLVVAPAGGAGAATGTTTRVSVTSGEAQVWGTSSQSEMSLDGRYVVFVSGAPNLVPGDTNGRRDIFVRVARP